MAKTIISASKDEPSVKVTVLPLTDAGAGWACIGLTTFGSFHQNHGTKRRHEAFFTGRFRCGIAAVDLHRM